MPLESIGADILFITSYGLNISCFTKKLGRLLFIYLFVLEVQNGFQMGITDQNMHKYVC